MKENAFVGLATAGALGLIAVIALFVINTFSPAPIYPDLQTPSWVYEPDDSDVFSFPDHLPNHQIWLEPKPPFEDPALNRPCNSYFITGPDGHAVCHDPDPPAGCATLCYDGAGVYNWQPPLARPK